MGFDLIAVSADPVEKHRELVDKQELEYALYTDPGLEAAKEFGLVFRLSPETMRQYEEYGIELQGETLPVPAVFLIDKEGQVQFQYANPDYRVRLDRDLLLAAARAMTK